MASLTGGAAPSGVLGDPASARSGGLHAQNIGLIKRRGSDKERFVNEKRTGQLNDVMSSLLQVGEQVAIGSFANVGSVSLGRKLAVAAAAGVLSGGMLLMNVRPRRLYVVLTNQRILFLEASAITGRPTTKIAGQVPRGAIIGCTAPKRGVMTVFDVLIAGQDKALHFGFPRPLRDDGEKFAAAIGVYAGQ
jgi:hypothetical protein